jgi:oligoendopeptidase F
MENFHPLFHSTAYDFFEKNWIDAEVRQGKPDGAFCKCLSPSQHPYISMHYNGNIQDVIILAHELGHGIQYILSSKQSYLNFNPSPVLAETASAFSEILVTRYLMEEKEFKNVLPTLIASHMEGILTTVFRQNVLTRFEQALHRDRQDHLLSEQEICQLWWEENNRLYGKDVEMVTGYQWGWTYIPHFVHRPFYCYSYIFGSLISIILFQNYMEKGDGFVEDIFHLFSSGSSRPPLEMLSYMGLNPGDKSFWEPAFQYISGLIDSLEAF